MAARAHDTAVRLRLATLADAVAIARLHIASWRTAYRAELPAPFLEALSETERAQEWRQRLAAPQMLVTLAEHEDSIVGFCMHGPAHEGAGSLTNVWEIYSLHVAPALRGSGIGSILFATARAHAMRAGACALTLWVVTTNIPAQRFYRAKAMQADGAARRRALANDISLDEIRFQTPLG